MIFSSVNMQLNYSPPVHIYRWVVAGIIALSPLIKERKRMSSQAFYRLAIALSINSVCTLQQGAS
jgi:hypothetical protein